jgi:seryl-tRNA(Sec) selenium transferase
MPTALVSLRPAHLSVAKVEERLRRGDPAVLCRIADDALLFDPRTLLDGDAEAIVTRLREVLV